MLYNSKNLILAKQLRKNMTKEEKILWQILRAKRFCGYKFKRQVLIGNYIVDFLCSDVNLVIELDGGQHNEKNNIISDKKRTEFLKEHGFKVLRFWNNEITQNIKAVEEAILNELQKRQTLS